MTRREILAAVIPKHTEYLCRVCNASTRPGVEGFAALGWRWWWHNDRAIFACSKKCERAAKKQGLGPAARRR